MWKLSNVQNLHSALNSCHPVANIPSANCPHVTPTSQINWLHQLHLAVIQETHMTTEAVESCFCKKKIARHGNDEFAFGLTSPFCSHTFYETDATHWKRTSTNQPFFKEGESLFTKVILNLADLPYRIIDLILLNLNQHQALILAPLHSTFYPIVKRKLYSYVHVYHINRCWYQYQRAWLDVFKLHKNINNHKANVPASMYKANVRTGFVSQWFALMMVLIGVILDL